jgi:hypothetical protein
MSEPTTPATSNGTGPKPRGPGRRFEVGNRYGKGNPHTKQVNQFRAELYKCVTVEDLRAVAAALIDKAKTGNVPAIRELLDRLIGRAPQAIHLVGEPAIAATDVLQVVSEVLEAEPVLRAQLAERLRGLRDERGVDELG